MGEVLVVDDQATWRSTLCDLVRAVEGLTVAGEAATGEEALAVAERLGPDLVLMDIRMPGLDGFETTRRLRAQHPDTVVLLVSVDGRDAAAVHACGAAAAVRKEDVSAQALRAAWETHRPG
jgi:DNA-binding NarL/FixJ family response regulator